MFDITHIVSYFGQALSSFQTHGERAWKVIKPSTAKQVAVFAAIAAIACHHALSGLMGTLAFVGYKSWKETKPHRYASLEEAIQAAPRLPMEKSLLDIPDWDLFFEKIKKSCEYFDTIYVNPAHTVAEGGKYAGSRGEEFATILEEKKKSNDKLNGIENLYTMKTDIGELRAFLKNTGSFSDYTIQKRVFANVTTVCVKKKVSPPIFAL